MIKLVFDGWAGRLEGFVLAVLFVWLLYRWIRRGATDGLGMMPPCSREKSPVGYWLTVSIAGVFLCASIAQMFWW